MSAGNRSVNPAERGHSPHACHPGQAANDANHAAVPEIEDDDLAGVHMGNVETVCCGIDALVVQPDRRSGKRDVLQLLERRGAPRGRTSGGTRSKEQNPKRSERPLSPHREAVRSSAARKPLASASVEPVPQ